MVVDAIITADMHLRDSVPEARTDSYFDAQAKKVKFISDLQKKYNVPILDGGDLLHKWKSSPFLETWSILNLPDRVYTVPGNHEIPSHNLNLLSKSSLSVLQAAKKIHLLTEEFCFFDFDTSDHTLWGMFVHPFPWGREIKHAVNDGLNKNIALTHMPVYQGEKLWPGMEATQARAVLKKNPDYDLIIVGHNHQPFVEKYEGRLLVSPGSMMRMGADQIEHRPRVYLWSVFDNTVEPVFLPIEQDVISREHLAKVEERDQRLETFVSRLTEDYEIGLSFEKNMEVFLAKNQIKKPIRNIVWEAINGVGE